MKRALAAVILLACVAAAAARDGAQTSPSVVVFVTSSHDLEFEYPLIRTFLSRWREREPLVSMLHYPMAPNAYVMGAEAVRLSIESIAKRLGGATPTIIVSQGDPAFFLALELRRSKYPAAPMIAFDVLGNEERRRQYEADTSLYIVVNSGIEELNAEFGARLFPKRDRIAVLIRIGNEKQHAEEVRRRIEAAAPGREIVMVINPDRQEVADPILRVSPERTFVLNLTPGWVDAQGNYLAGKEHVKSISTTYGLPVIEHFRTMLDEGIVGGVGFSPMRWGVTAADMALGLVFDGKEPERWMRISTFATAFADYRELTRFGASPKLLPPGTELINEPPPAWLRYQKILEPLLILLLVALVLASARAFFKRRESRLLEATNLRLEREVVDRTKELRASNEDLAVSNRSLSEAIRRTEEMQETVLRSAREITLGRFSAGMANGLNSPLAAIRSSAATILSIWNEGNLVPSLFGLDEGQKALFLAYAPRALSRSGIPVDPAAIEIVDLERRLAPIASGDISSLALDLADAGLSELGDDELRAFSDERGRAVARELYRLAAVARSAWIIGEASCRAAEIVKAVRDYVTESGADEEPVDVDLRATIERALLILKNRVPPSIRLENRLEEVPPVHGFESAFMRIWAALIQNALQAMPGGGRLGLSLRREGDMVLVSVTDEGPGVDPAIADRLFEPFVTTRHLAEGMGLGLAFCKRSLESVGGNISYVRRAIGSEFLVRLPISPSWLEGRS